MTKYELVTTRLRIFDADRVPLAFARSYAAGAEHGRVRGVR